ncbi:DUF4386 domain-containing protein [Dactylosporangium sp. CA-139066]|uniref:DUF4386 domain-containing protein n=1 Tax=Dactylosporangium sp. CA-139066 TaxID=3239930 RepID=UPI003D90CC33
MSPRKTALLGGVFYLVTFAASFPALFLLGPILDDPRYILSAGADGRVTLGAVLDIVNALACVGTAVSLFPVVRRQDEATALGFVTSRVLEAATIMIGVIALLAVISLRQDLHTATGAEADALVGTGRALVTVRNWTFLLGPSLMASLNALLLGSLMYRSRLVPRFIPTMGLIGGPLLLLSTIAVLFGAFDQVSPISAVATLPVAAWELSVGVYLTFKGFRPSSPVLAPA